MINPRFIEKLEEIAGRENVRVDEPMCAHTTFKVGGPADALVTPPDCKALEGVLAACADAGVPLHVMGRGSNLLVSDDGVRGVVVKFADGLSTVLIEGEDGTRVAARAGASNASVARKAQRAGLAGFEFAAGIPGTIGGAALMNAGAYGGEFKDVATSLLCYTLDGKPVTVSADEAAWGYRSSMMADAGLIVWFVMLALTPDDPAAIQARMDDLAQRRRDKQPLELPSAGSTFKRPEGHFAGKLIQDAGLRGYRVGGAQVSEKHCGFVVNVGDATAADVLQVIRDVQERVQAQSGILLEPEVRLWGFDE